MDAVKEVEDQPPESEKAESKTDTMDDDDDSYEFNVDIEDDYLNVEDLKTLNIICYHEVPEQHRVEICAGSRMPTADIKNKIVRACEEAGLVFKTGRFSQEEDFQIRENWRKFCENYNWDSGNPVPFLFMKHKGKYFMPNLLNRMNFVRNLAKNLYNRSLYSVYFRFRKLYSSSIIQGRYTEDEDAMILTFLKDRKPDLAAVAGWLGRPRQSIYHRSLILKRKK